MSRYEKLNLTLTFLALLAALYVGVIQNSINQSLLNFNYEPALSIQYTKPATGGPSGINILNNGKANVTFYNVIFGGATSTFVAEQAIIDTDAGSTIPPGLFIYSTPSISMPALDQVMTDKNSNVLIPVSAYFETGNGNKYIMQTWLHFWSSSNERIVNYGPVNYIRFDWKEK